jgi:murein L,D-transpeptidase YcbB/YkuD
MMQTIADDRMEGGMSHALLVVCLLLTQGIWGCGEASDTDPEAPAPRTERAREAVEAVDHTLGGLLEAQARQRARQGAIADLLERDGLKGVLYGDVLKHLYRERTPVWLRTDTPGLRLNAEGRQLWSTLRDGVEAHGLWPDDLNTDRLRQIFARSGMAEPSPLRSMTLRPSERQALIERLAETEGAWSADDAAEVVPRILSSQKQSPVPRIRKAVDARVAALNERADRAARTELYLSDALVAYLRRMRWDNPAWYADRVWHATFRRGIRGPLKPGRELDDPEDRGSAARRVGAAVSEARTAAFSADHARQILAEPAGVGNALQEIVPRYEQYRRLTRAFRRYRPVVEHGGWPEIPPHGAGLEAGNFAPVVGTLKERLRIEGYYDEPEADDPTQEHFYDRELVDAVTAYQATHQLYEVGSVTEQTLRSLNIPAETRWHQMRVTLQRWRDSRIGPDTHYVHVNIPDYHAEVWRDGERQLRFKVVVGSSERKVEEETGRVQFPHQTPRFSDRLEYMVMNPYWNVPHSIWQNEIKKEKEENPDLYEEEGYEVVEDDNGYRFLRQKPGPKNALGRVKFLFPNKHSVYMHDTPAKGLFRRPTRAASHGCIRVSEPMKLANYLLDLDGRWQRGERRDKQFKRWFDRETETWVQLQKTVPVHIEYYVVRVDEEGRAHFLADPYDLDDPLMAAVGERIKQYPGGYDLPGVQPDEMMRLALSGDLKERETPASAW